MAHGSAGYRQKRSRGHGPGSSDENCGDLSSLPDPLFHHILSFLPMKQVVQTSLVSRRWRDVWTHVPVLDLDERSFSRIEGFRGFIDRVLGCHRVARLQKFFLSFSDFDNTGVVVPHAMKLILRWVRYAAEHFIEEIDLSVRLYWEESIKLPGSLFSCEYLTVMKLNLNDAYLLLPEYMHLPSLKDLQLIRVKIQGLGSSFQQLLSGCPKLEKLSIIDCTLENFEILDFSGCLHLEILRMKHFRWIDGNAIHISSPKLRTLILKSSVEPICEMRISAPNLRHFKYDSMPWTLSIERLSSLVNAHIGRLLGLHIFSSDDDDGCPLKERVNNMVLVLFRGLENARRLFIAGDSLKFITRALDSSECLPTLFSNLEYLELEIDLFDKANIQSITSFLKLSPNLERLVINNDQHWIDYECWGIEEFPLDHLKEVEIRCTNISEDIINFAKFFITNAAVLEILIISSCGSSTSQSISQERKHKISKELLGAPRASLGIAILIV